MRSLELPRAAATGPSARPRERRRRRGAALGSLTWPTVRGVGRHSGLQRRAAIGGVVADARRGRGRGTRSSSSTTARPTTRARRPPRPARAVVRHPYNKGNGAAVKSGHPRGHRRVRADHRRRRPAQPDDARRLVARLGEYDLVIGARSGADAGDAGAPVRQRGAQLARELPDRTRHSGSHVRIPRGAARAPARVPAPAAERLLDADDDDAGVHQGGLQRRVRAGRSAAARRHLEDPPRARRRRSSS